MSIVKSFSVGHGDMFYIKHGSDNFTIIDCSLSEDNKVEIVSELETEAKGKGIIRFISTHPDNDHISGLKYLESEMGIANFYCVQNNATKRDVTDDFKTYCALRDDSAKAFYLFEGCSRLWMNKGNEERGSSGISILWPKKDNVHYKQALEDAKNGLSPNNISTIIKYSLNDGLSILWMGDLETGFMENIKDDLDLSEIDILFAPHHGRESGKVPQELLLKMNPKLIIIGEAPAQHLNYYGGYNTITQNSTGDITLDCEAKKVHIYVTNSGYSVDFLDDEDETSFNYYIGTLNL